MPPTTLAIIAGGKGVRMGQPKILLSVQGQPILRYLLRKLDWSGPTMLVTAPGIPMPAETGEFDRHVVDPVENEGPLRGVLTALQHATMPMVVTITVDMPNIERGQLDWLIATLESQPDDLAVMVELPDHIEPFPAAYRRTAAATIERRLQAGQRSVQRITEEKGFLALPSPAWPESTWANLNTPRDLEQFEL